MARALSKRHRQVLEALERIGAVATTFQVAVAFEGTSEPLGVNGVARLLGALERAGHVVEVRTRGRRGGDRLWRVVKEES
jgi:hypothetical protein